MGNFIRSGLLAGGNWIVDFVKIIHTYPQENALANILNQEVGNGGAPFNVLKALFKMKVAFPLEGVGRVGDDETGAEIMTQCQSMQINSSQLKVCEGIDTSYTDVMTVAETGKRTFFHYRGANALLDTCDFDFSTSGAKIFHLGYLLLLDKLDEIDENGLTGAAKVFRKAKEVGLITSADVVSEQSERYTRVIPAALPFIDYLFINELEVQYLTGLDLTMESGGIALSVGFRAARIILDMGVLQWVVIHFPEGALAVSKGGEEVFQPAVQMPAHYIKGTVGAGDAFAAGVLAGIHDSWPMQKSLRLGVSVAARSLLCANASEGIVALEECLQFGQEMGYRSECHE